MAKKTLSEFEVEKIIGNWHAGKLGDAKLHHALGWTWEEYVLWSQTDIIPTANATVTDR